MLLWSREPHHGSKGTADDDYRRAKCNIAGIEKGMRRFGLPFFVVVHVVIPVACVLVCADRTEGSKDRQARIARSTRFQGRWDRHCTGVRDRSGRGRHCSDRCA